MYSVIIVEDEMIVRAGIKASIDWGKFNMNVVDELSDGASGLECFKKIKPDIVITDINLPRLHGIDFIKEIRKIDTECLIVVITCIDDFKTMKELVDYDIMDYLIKSTIDLNRFEKTLTNCRTKLHEMQKSIKPKSDNINPFANQIKKFITNNNQDIDIKNQFEISLDDYDDYFVFIKPLLIDSNQQLTIDTINELLSNVFSQQNSFKINFIESSVILVFFKKDVFSKMMIIEKLETFKKYIFKVLNIRTVISLETHQNQISLLKDKYIKFNEYTEHLPIEIITISGMESLIEKLHKNVFNFKNLTYKILLAFTYKIELNYPLDNFEKKNLYNFRDFKKIVYSSLNILISDSSQISNQIDLFDIIGNENTFSGLYLSCRKFLFENYYAERKMNLRKEVIKSIQFIEENYSDVISLDDIADKACLSANYMSSLFKKEFGMTFVDYLNLYRVQMSIQYLEETKEFLYTIAENTGFTYESYFSKIFKKITGFSPNYWRKMFQK